MKLYEFAPTRSIRARWLLQELGIDFESVEVNLLAGENRHPEFLALNPEGKLPVLVDGDLVLTESVAIALYLAEKDPEKRFLPADVRLRAQVYRWLFFAATELEQPLWRIARHTRLYPEPQRLPADVAIAGREFVETAGVLAKHMREREFVVGERLTVADFVMAYTLDWGHEAGLLGGFPQLLAYVQRMYARPRAALRIADAVASLRVHARLWRPPGRESALAPGDAMSADEPLRSRREAIVRLHMQAENDHDFDAVIETFAHPRYELIATGQVHDGEAAVRQYFRDSRTAFPDQRNELISLRHAEDGVIVELCLLGTHRGPLAGLAPSGKAFRCQMTAFFLFEGAGLVCERVYFDSATILRQIAS